ncbi:MAG: GNAT family N-acetyltransferase, partial [Lachnospiraceae bacterium]|nr:GNAT family N-acetyltransferase [Lachnospiraceae bacterium]
MDRKRKKKTESGTDVLDDGVITLRPVTAEDTDLILRWRNADFVRRHFIFRETLTREMHEKWLATKVRSGEVVQFILCTGTPEADGHPFGSVYLRDVDHDAKCAEFGIFIGEADALGKGYGTRATRMMLAYAFDSLGLTRV